MTAAAELHEASGLVDVIGREAQELGVEAPRRRLVADAQDDVVQLEHVERRAGRGRHPARRGLVGHGDTARTPRGAPRTTAAGTCAKGMTPL